MDYEPVIGLETHAELLTASKLWCRCSTRFGQDPNTQTCPVCLGMPGSLPVMNVEAFELALTAALALNCRINRTTFFDRKNYYYPDLPKNYQISQNYCNLGDGGRLEAPVDGRTASVGITNVHLEEDAGKNLHVDSPGAEYSLVDLNRAGTPLLEVVSAPDMHSVEEADAFMQTLRQILLYTRVSDCKMQEGSLRFEASISMRPAGTEELGPRVEIKNLNSMKAVRGALAYEIRRQAKALEKGEKVDQETRLWDEVRERTGRMRSKEEAQDYRYFPEPDLLPIHITDEMIEGVQAAMPELPLARRRRFVEEYGLSEYDATVLTDLRETADYFEQCLDFHDAPKSIANWIINVVLGDLNERKIGIAEFELNPEQLAGLVARMDEGEISQQIGKKVMVEMVSAVRQERRAKAGEGIALSPASEDASPLVSPLGTVDGPDGPAARSQADETVQPTQDVGVFTSQVTATQIIQELGVSQISDEGELGAVVDHVITENEKTVQDYLGGRKKAIGALVGQVMRATRGQADPQLANRLLREKLDAMR